MNKLLLVLGFALLSIFTSCDKCKDVDCQNGASCDKGDCECTAFYSGDKCETEVRNNYTNIYYGNFAFDGEIDSDSLLVQLDGTSATGLRIFDTPMKLTLTSANAFTISGDHTDRGDTYTFSGTGTISSTVLTMDGSVAYTENGDSGTETFTFSGNRVQ